MKCVILAGGFGTRLEEETSLKPKPMVEIGGHPIMWHIMKIYAHHNIREFIIALGYKGEVIKRYFLDYYHMHNNLSVQLSTGNVEIYKEATDDWLVHLVDTGLHTQTGGRLKRLSSWIGQETFMMTYGDGVSNININELLAFHRAHGRLATVTAVCSPARFGGLSLDGDLVTRFIEKPPIGEGWVNGGFFVFEPEVLRYIEDDSTVLERVPLERLADNGQLVAYQHEGFWQSMDTLRDVRLLESLWRGGSAPWNVW